MYRILYLCLLLTVGEAAAQQMPERAAVRSGNRQFHKGNYEESIERYRKALTFAPSSFEATYDLGNALYEAERYSVAAPPQSPIYWVNKRTASEGFI